MGAERPAPDRIVSLDQFRGSTDTGTYWERELGDPYRDPIPPIPREIIAEAARIYVSVFETITGQSFSLADPETPVLERIRANLRRFF